MRPFILLALVGSLFLASQTQAQGLGVHVGPKAGLTLSTLDGQPNTYWRSGFSGGLMMRCRSSERFALQPELLYVEQGARGTYSQGSRPDYDVQLSYFQVPLLAKIYIGSVLNLQAGPQAGLLLAAREVGTRPNDSGLPEAVNKDVKEDYYDLDVSLSGGVGIDLPNGLLARLRYNYGFVDTKSDKAEANVRRAMRAGGVHNRGLEFSVGYLVGAGKSGN